MLRRTRKRLYLSRGAAAIAELDRANRLVVLKNAELPGGDPIASIAPALNDWSNHRYLEKISEVVVDDHWCRFFMVAPPLNAVRLSDLTFATAERFRVLYDEEPVDWVVDGDWHATKPFLACAMYRPLLAAMDAVGMRRMRVVVPQTVDYANRYGKYLRHRYAWLTTTGADRAVITVYDRDSIADVHQAPIVEGMWDSFDRFRVFIDRECLRLNRPPPSDVLLCGPIQVQWASTVVNGTSIRIESESLINEVDSNQLRTSPR